MSRSATYERTRKSNSQGQQLMKEQEKATEEDPCHPNKWVIHITHSRIQSPTHKYTYPHIAFYS